MAINPKDFLLNTDYEMDKVILVKTGNFTDVIEFQHGLSFTPLIFGIWSLDSNFTSANQLGPTFGGTEPPGSYSPPLGVTVRTSDTRVRLAAIGDGESSATIYYRLYAMAPTESNADIPATSGLANTFMVNTDYNYRKLKATGEFTSGGQSYTHNLGYIPQVMAWIKYKNIDIPSYNYNIEPLNDGSYFTDYLFEVTPTTIKVANNFPFMLIEKVIWKIYYDEA